MSIIGFISKIAKVFGGGPVNHTHDLNRLNFIRLQEFFHKIDIGGAFGFE